MDVTSTVFQTSDNCWKSYVIKSLPWFEIYLTVLFISLMINCSNTLGIFNFVNLKLLVSCSYLLVCGYCDHQTAIKNLPEIEFRVANCWVFFLMWYLKSTIRVVFEGTWSVWMKPVASICETDSSHFPGPTVVAFFACWFVCLAWGGYTYWCSGLTLDSAFRNYSWLCLRTIWGIRNWTQGSRVQSKCPMHCTFLNWPNRFFL